jgi:hypothetical protein
VSEDLEVLARGGSVLGAALRAEAFAAAGARARAALEAARERCLSGAV